MSSQAIPPVQQDHVDALHNAPTAPIEHAFDQNGEAKPRSSEIQHRDRLSSARTKIGLEPEAPLDDEHVNLRHHDLLWSQTRYVFREPFAEFFGYALGLFCAIVYFSNMFYYGSVV